MKVLHETLPCFCLVGAELTAVILNVLYYMMGLALHEAQLNSVYSTLRGRLHLAINNN